MSFLESKGGEMTMIDVLDEFDTDDTEIMEIAKELRDRNMILIKQQGKSKPVKFITRVGPITRKCAHTECNNLAVKGGAFCVECNLKEKEKHKSDIEIVDDEEEEQEEEESEEPEEEEKSDKEEQAVVDEMIKRSPDAFEVDEEAAASWAKHQEIIGAVYIFAFKEGKESMRARISCIVPRHAL
jgi:hypothetical protein